MSDQAIWGICIAVMWVVGFVAYAVVSYAEAKYGQRCDCDCDADDYTTDVDSLRQHALEDARRTKRT